MPQARLFTSRVVDEFGGVFPNAVLGILEFSTLVQETGISKDCVGEYSMETEPTAITYKINYWYTEATKLEGRRPRKLIQEQDGEDPTDVFVVDLDRPGVTAIMESGLDSHEKKMKVIEADVAGRFS